MADQLALRLRITGRVQGVGYRYWVIGEARRFRLAGWVRNRADGAVEVLVCGVEAGVAALIERAWVGPAGAQVAGIEQFPAEPPTRADFIRLPTE
jgi:acylphosphatase